MSNPKLVIAYDNQQFIRRQYTDTNCSLDTEPWPILKWIRRNAYPFTTIGDQYFLVWLILSMVFLLVWSAGTGAVIGSFGRAFTANGTAPFDKLLLLYPLLGAIRLVCLPLELYVWNSTLSTFIRTRWAASFSDSNEAHKLLNKVHPPILLETNTFIPFGGLAGILFLLWLPYRKAWLLWCSLGLLAEFVLRTSVKCFSIRYYKFIHSSLESWNDRLGPGGAMLLTVYMSIMTATMMPLTLWAVLRKPWMLWFSVGIFLLCASACLADFYCGFIRNFIDYIFGTEFGNEEYAYTAGVGQISEDAEADGAIQLE